MLDKLNIERPYWGYFAELKVHDTKRPKPVKQPDIFPNPTDSFPEDAPRPAAKYHGRYIHD